VLDEALRALLSAPPHAVKVIVTTRVAPRGLLLDHPERQRRLDLDEGLPSPYAEEVLRARDPDGRLGLKTAPDELLDQARQRTRGYPRALEALAAILAADRGTTLPELLDQMAGLPGNVVAALVGEAFSRLDPLAQQVMQALAVYPVPVPPVAVDYLLQPYQPAIDAAPVLGRLVNMQFVRREAGRYYLHQVDRDYALSRLPDGEPADRDADPPVFTRQALRHRGAGYFEQTRTPREDWKSLDDLGPQLAEFELRCQSGDYDTAAAVLADIDFDHLRAWGHYRMLVGMHGRIHGRITDPILNAGHLSNLGATHVHLGEFRQAIGVYAQALDVARSTGERQFEGSALVNLGNCYYRLGEYRRAIDLDTQALAIAREIGDRSEEAVAVEYLGRAWLASGDALRAVTLLEQAVSLADTTGDIEPAVEARSWLARAHLQLGDPAAALAATTARRELPYPTEEPMLRLLEGLALLDLHRLEASVPAFSAAVTAANALLALADSNVAALQARALALSGLAAATGSPAQAVDAEEAFARARAVTSAPGVLAGTHRLFEQIACHDRSGVLARVRAAQDP